MIKEFTYFTYDKYDIDKNKKNLFLIYENFYFHSEYETYHVSTAWANPWIEQIKNKYNIFILSLTGSDKYNNKNIELNKKYKFNLINFRLNRLKKDLVNYLRVKDDKNSTHKNLIKSDNNIKEILDELPIIDEIHIIDDYHFLLPLRKYVKLPPEFETKISDDNSFFDYIGNNHKIKKFIEDNLNSLIADINIGKCLSPIAFSMQRNFFAFRILNLLFNNYNAKKLIMYVYDPNVFYPYVMKLANDEEKYEIRYFENDNRGTRNFKEFPIQELQYLYYGSQYLTYHNIKREKDKLFLFEGTIFTTRCKNSREFLWNKYLTNLKLNDSGYYFKNNEESSLFNEIKNHPSYMGSYDPIDKFKTIQDYRYSLIIKPIILNDSLNFRLAQSILLQQLPLFADEYDKENLLKIDKKIKEKLTVKSSKDIEEKISYFEKNQEEFFQIVYYFYKYFLDKIEKFQNKHQVKISISPTKKQKKLF